MTTQMRLATYLHGATVAISSTAKADARFRRQATGLPEELHLFTACADSALSWSA